MAGKKFYAVLSGRKPGIYESWPLAQAQVKGFPGARFKGFATRREAELWLKEPGEAARPARVARAARAAAPARRDLSEPAPPAGEVVIYTDGGSINNPGPGGYGVVAGYDGAWRELTGGFRLTTNNRMELMGCIVALRNLVRRDRPVTIYSDSSYVVNGINKGWAEGWRRRGWLKADKSPALNTDLWAELLDLVSGLDITFKWVRGHAGNRWNERCDVLAVASARKEDLPPDPGYEESAGN